MICFDDASKVYARGATAVDRLTLEVPNGMLTVFVGPSGCGKTTALRMINRMVDPTRAPSLPTVPTCRRSMR